MGIEKVLEKMSKMDYGTLLTTARYASGVVLSSDYVRSMVANAKTNTKDTEIALILLLISHGIGADHKITEKEKFFISDLLHLDVKHSVEMAKGIYDTNKIRIVDEMVDAADDATKAAMIQLVCAVCACDGAVTYPETELVRKLVAE